jgi:hypothetical protein
MVCVLVIEEPTRRDRLQESKNVIMFPKNIYIYWSNNLHGLGLAICVYGTYVIRPFMVP